MITDKMAQDYAAMNDALNAETKKALPTRAEVLEALAASDMGMPDRIEDAPFEVFFIPSKTWAKDIDGVVELNTDERRIHVEIGCPVRCQECGRKAGEVTLMRAHPKLRRERGHTVYVCKGGCPSQNSLELAVNRASRQYRHASMRLTASGRALRWVTDKEQGTRVEYALTPREVGRRKANRKQQAASRRANRAR